MAQVGCVCVCVCIWGEKNDEPSPSVPGGRCPLSKVEEQLRTVVPVYNSFLKNWQAHKDSFAVCVPSVFRWLHFGWQVLKQPFHSFSVSGLLMLFWLLSSFVQLFKKSICSSNMGNDVHESRGSNKRCKCFLSWSFRSDLAGHINMQVRPLKSVTDFQIWACLVAQW